MLAMLIVPPARETVVYFVPDGKWVAVTVAPTIGSSELFFTTPVMADVVICANNRGLATKAKAKKKITLLSI
jgi:hypothetical protein